MDVEYFNKNAGAVPDSALRIVSARGREIAALKKKRAVCNGERRKEICAEIKKKHKEMQFALSRARFNCRKIADRVRHHIRRDAILKESGKTGNIIFYVSDADVSKRLQAVNEAENALLKKLE